MKGNFSAYTFTYDALQKRTGVRYHDTSTVAATYDAANRLRTLVDSASGTLSWDYDTLDQVVQAVTP
ncbi:MAG TPA: hypothetical protein VK364_09445 [Hymenobacter sp.]|nr:hypothetical protein [Hymenobacter sp.]